MESYEVEINGRTFPVKAVRNITGHNIDQYRIHAGKSVPFVKHDDNTKMEEGEIFAIETFGTTGRGYLFDGVRSISLSLSLSRILYTCTHRSLQPGVYGYGKDPFAPKKITSHLASAKSLYQKINENFGSLVFCRRYLERLGVERYLAGVGFSRSSSTDHRLTEYR
jgi:methionyl aminopeptidase